MGITTESGRTARPPDRPLRVCHLGKFYPPASGGIETHVQALARAQAELEMDVSVLCVNHRDRQGRDVTFSPLAITPTQEGPDGKVRVRRLGRVASLARLDVALAIVPELLRLRGAPPDVVHLHSPNPTMLLGLSALPPFSTLVITHHSDVIRQRVLGAAFRAFERRVYRRAALVLPTSPLYLEGSPLLQEVAERVRPLPLGIDLGPFLRPSPAALAHAEEFRRRFPGPRWLCAGRLVYYKGLPVALEALREAQGHLLVAGSGPLRAELERRARELQVADRVSFLGHVEHDVLVGAYLAATALWFPSVARSEGFGLSQVEAMACGCPVINTSLRGSGVSWVSLHERTGLTVPVGDARALAAAARRLLDDPALRARLSETAVHRASEEFSLRTMGERCAELYREALDAARAGRAGPAGRAA